MRRGLGEQPMTAEALNVLGTASWFGCPDDAEPLLDDALNSARALRDDTLASLVLVNLGSGAGEIRRYDRAVHWLSQAANFAAARDLDARHDYAIAWLARVALEQGELGRAEELAGLVRPQAELISRVTAQTVLGRVAVRRSRGSAVPLLREAWALAESTGDLQRLWPVAAGLAEESHAAATALPDEVRATYELAVPLRHPWAVGELGWWLTRAGQVPAGDVVSAGAAPPYVALVEGRYLDAAASWDELGCPYDAALARVEHDDPAVVAAALASLDRRGCRGDGDRAAARLRELGAPVPRRTRGGTAAHPDGLTQREAEVLALLRDGLTNAEVAQRMHISVKTAGHHVSTVLAKLGVTSRREAARR